eukprot:6190389-Pleurochrysis_carterae.AAC.1
MPGIALCAPQRLRLEAVDRRRFHTPEAGSEMHMRMLLHGAGSRHATDAIILRLDARDSRTRNAKR